MESYIQIFQLTERIIHKYNRSEEIRRDYGLGYLMSRKEIHTIDAIGRQPGINMKTLTLLQGVTKGATSQMVGRLVEKGLVEKRESSRSEAEVTLFLTVDGKRAYQGHREYHKSKEKEWREHWNTLSHENQKVVIEIMQFFDHQLDNKFLE